MLKKTLKLLLLGCIGFASCEKTENDVIFPGEGDGDNETEVDTSGVSIFNFHYDEVSVLGKEVYPVRLLEGEIVEMSHSQYGGNLKKQYDKTGFFYTKQINGYWYLVDPDGYEFITAGLNSVEKGGDIDLPGDLYDMGVNTIGCWSDETIPNIAYTPRWNFAQTYKNEYDRGALWNVGVLPIFDPEYEIFCDQHAKQLAARKNDPFLLGHFSDNEIALFANNSYGALLPRYLNISDKTDPNFVAVNQWMIERKGPGYTTDEQDEYDFHGFLADRYYKVTSEAIKRYDPNHLYLGSRLHGNAKFVPSIYQAAGKYVDMISINFYNRWEPESQDMYDWAAGGAPFFITEYYVKGDDTGLNNVQGEGWTVPTQEDRGKFFQNFTMKLLEHPGCVGFHWFRYIDNESNGLRTNQGIVSKEFEWYMPLKEKFEDVTKDIYALREFLINENQ
ncbi:hypothetical protein KMW28_19270 [Flammeovirga yaeyamensis]|uniref:Beta-agarase n=1 Tax=Flammeovirga yaeyamensis TaxID=367791 RepID=A0AAX1N785_9BACT|nr:hypothetical protein [Flammeovirga yaeyamensis]MBB3700763.1 hypothetical protein [Flammeovirga yaeyamensis]NMF37881.1 hypothetical protein [Flammeovirga yaeyamensis]QWG01758.1 hypothetical protein KMW28_19270 [Flammeovirga yaeyamensis]